MVVPSSHPFLYDFPSQTIHLPGYSHCRKLPYIYIYYIYNYVYILYIYVHILLYILYIYIIYIYIIHYPSIIIPLPSSLLLRSQVPYWRLRAQHAWSTRWDSCLSGSPVALQDGSVLNNQLYLGLSSTSWSYWTHVWENNPNHIFIISGEYLEWRGTENLSPGFGPEPRESESSLPDNNSKS